MRLKRKKQYNKKYDIQKKEVVVENMGLLQDA